MMLLNKSYWTVKTTKNKGRGIFANKNILPGTLIGDYRGKIIHPDEEDEIAQNGFYAMCWHEEIAFMPADLTVEDIHLINHSCAPNLCMYPYQGHILYVS
jgi:SET domain-containing protein